MSEIDWSKAPEWADRVVRGKKGRACFWANDSTVENISSGNRYCTSLHIRDNWEVVERRPTVNTGIDWNKAPHWADRVVRLPGMRHLYWADDTQRQSVEHGRYRKDNDNVKARWEVVERRFLDDPHLPPKTFNCKCVVGYRTIDQRIASLRALEKQVEETRAELTRDLEALGLTWMVRDEPEQPTITDWRDLRVGDVVECVGNWEGENTNGKQFSVTKLEPIHSLSTMPIQITIDGVTCPETWGGTFRFIRRP